MIGRTLALVVILGACAPQAPTPASTYAQPRSGGTLVVAWQEPETLNPLYAAGIQAAAAVYAVAVEGLVRVTPDGTFAPLLAREVPTPENGLVTPDGTGMRVRYRLRDGIVWSDGAPFTSADVRFTWERVMVDTKVASREGYDLITAIDTPDEHTVDVRYRELYGAYLTRFDAILPRHALAGIADLTAYGTAPLGTGPFRIVEFARGSHVIAERNERYRIAGRPHLDRIVFRFVPSIEAAKLQLKAGEVHAAFNVSEADAADLERDANIRLASARSPIVESLSFNLARRGDPADPAVRHPVLGDRAMRSALLLATPKEEIVRRLLSGRAAPGRSEIPIGWAADDAIAQEGFDPARARAILDEAGWKTGSDGVRRRGDVRARIEITSTTGNKLREQIEQVLVDSWREVGVEAVIRNVPSATLVAGWTSKGVRRRGDFDVILAQLGLGTVGGTDPQGYLAQRHRCDTIPRAENGGAGGNWERFCDARVDRLLDEAGRTLDVARRRAVYSQVLRIVNEEVVAIWLFERSRINAFRADVGGYATNPWDTPTWDVHEWHLAAGR